MSAYPNNKLLINNFSCITRRSLQAVLRNVTFCLNRAIKILGFNYFLTHSLCSFVASHTKLT